MSSQQIRLASVSTCTARGKRRQVSDLRRHEDDQPHDPGVVFVAQLDDVTGDRFQRKNAPASPITQRPPRIFQPAVMGHARIPQDVAVLVEIGDVEGKRMPIVCTIRH